MRVLTIANHLESRGGLERTQLTTARLLASTWGAAAAARAGARLRPSVVYPFRYWDVPLALAVGALGRAPVVFHLCLPPPAAVPRWLVAALRRLDAVVSVSRDTAERWAPLGVDPDRVTVVLTGVDTDVFRPLDDAERASVRAGLGLPVDGPLAVYAGRLDRDKGVEVAVAAVGRSEAAGLHLAVAGGPSFGADPADSAAYRAELEAAAAAGRVSFLGPLKDAGRLVAAADVAVVPSRWPDPLPRAVLEPLACGVPVVASAVGGIPEAMGGFLADLLVAPGDERALAATLGAVAGWRRDRPDLGPRCRAWAEAHFSTERDVAGIEAVLAGAHRRRPRR